MTAHTFDVVVTPDVRAFILEWSKERRGAGGFQSLYRLLADRLKASRVLRVSSDEMERISRYATDYGEGGHQQVLRKLLALYMAQHVRD